MHHSESEEDISTLNKEYTFEAPRYHQISSDETPNKPNLQRSTGNVTNAPELKSTDTKPSHTTKTRCLDPTPTPLPSNTRMDSKETI
ncbi:unnamed protein product [Arabis nemorensis]|uniref:Uncharacterized protein n=1 Tax=Arabis nemorensis TaxID=586526 RepID=A0A565B4D1_9BRAS|nr:unnamed protein product [Arabis nemorensis]